MVGLEGVLVLGCKGLSGRLCMVEGGSGGGGCRVRLWVDAVGGIVVSGWGLL